jgi:transposase
MSLIAPTVQAFFAERLITQRNASPRTIAAYRDTLRLLLRYAQEQTGKQPCRLEFADLDAPLIGAILAHLDFLDQQIEVLSGAIEVKLAPFAAAVDLLRTIPGIEVRTAQNVIAEIGTDMTQFPSADHLASWGGQCPGNHQSTGKRRSGKSRKGSKWLNQALKEAAMAAPRTNDSYLQALYRRKRSQLGHARALGAVKHSILCAMWHMLTTGELYRDLGGDYYQRRDPERQTRRLVAQLERLGHTVTLQETAIAA